MKLIDGRICRKYGSEKTHLTLTEKAEKFYSVTDPYYIYECETDDEAGYTTYLYTTRGFTDTTGVWMTEHELNEMLEAEADEIAAAEQDEDEFRQLPSPAVDTYAEDEWRLDVVKHDDGSAEGWLYVEGAEAKMHTLTDDEETVINSFVAGEFRNQYTKEFIEEE